MPEEVTFAVVNNAMGNFDLFDRLPSLPGAVRQATGKNLETLLFIGNTVGPAMDDSEQSEFSPAWEWLVEEFEKGREEHLRAGVANPAELGAVLSTDDSNLSGQIFKKYFGALKIGKRKSFAGEEGLFSPRIRKIYEKLAGFIQKAEAEKIAVKVMGTTILHEEYLPESADLDFSRFPPKFGLGDVRFVNFGVSNDVPFNVDDAMLYAYCNGANSRTSKELGACKDDAQDANVIIAHQWMPWIHKKLHDDEYLIILSRDTRSEAEKEESRMHEKHLIVEAHPCNAMPPFDFVNVYEFDTTEVKSTLFFWDGEMFKPGQASVAQEAAKGSAGNTTVSLRRKVPPKVSPEAQVLHADLDEKAKLIREQDDQIRGWVTANELLHKRNEELTKEIKEFKKDAELYEIELTKLRSERVDPNLMENLDRARDSFVDLAELIKKNCPDITAENPFEVLYVFYEKGYDQRLRIIGPEEKEQFGALQRTAETAIAELRKNKEQIKYIQRKSIRLLLALGKLQEQHFGLEDDVSKAKSRLDGEKKARVIDAYTAATKIVGERRTAQDTYFRLLEIFKSHTELVVKVCSAYQALQARTVSKEKYDALSSRASGLEQQLAVAKPAPVSATASPAPAPAAQPAQPQADIASQIEPIRKTAYMLVEQHRLDEGIQAYTLAIKIAPKDDPKLVVLYMNRGAAYYNKGDDARAVSDFKTAKQICLTNKNSGQYITTIEQYLAEAQEQLKQSRKRQK